MVRSSGKLAHLLLFTASVTLAACGGAKPTMEPVEEEEEEEAPPPKPKKETEADREAKRLKLAHEIVPDDSTCLPATLKADGAPALELAAIGADLVVCAVDTDASQLLGPVGCWTVNVADGSLAYRTPAPMPGRGYSVKLDTGCARGFCLPNKPKLDTAHMVWSPDGGKVAVLAGDEVHLFATDGKAHESSFTIRGDKGVTNEPFAIHWLGETMFVEGRDAGPFSAVWAYKTDGTIIGPIEAIGGKPGTPVSTHGGSFLLLDKTHVGVAAQGYSTVTVYEAGTGQRSKLVRKVATPACKAAELQGWWQTSGEVSAKCKAQVDKAFGHLIGATAVMGKTSVVTLLRGPRLGEIGVLDAKTLGEKKVIKLPWCAEEAAGGAPAASGGEAEASAPKASARKASAAPPKAMKSAAPAEAADPDDGGE